MDEGIKVSSHLKYQPFDPRPKEVPPQVLYSRYVADSSDQSGWTFDITSPAPNALLDNQVIIEYTISFTSIAAGAADFALQFLPDNIETIPNMGNFPALRGGWPVARAYNNLSVTINGVNVNTQPNKWIDPMTRLCISDEEASSICTLSGGELDVGRGYSYGRVNFYCMEILNFTATHTTPTLGAVTWSEGFVNGRANATSAQPVAARYCINEAYDKRHDRLSQWISDSKEINQSNRAAAHPSVIKVKIYERLPLSPFFFFESKDLHHNIPNIRTMSITAQFMQSYFKYVIQQTNTTNLIYNFDLVAEAPVLHMRWNMTAMQIPLQITIKCPIIKTFQQSIGTILVDTTQKLPNPTIGTQLMKTINLEGVPDLILIYAAPSDPVASFSNDMFLAISSLQITIGGSSGKLNTMNPSEIYQTYLRNLRITGGTRLPFNDWYRYHCCAALLPDDLGLQKGPGFNFPTQMLVECNFENYHVVEKQWGYGAINILGAAGSAFNFYVAVYYDKYALTLSNAGAAKLELLKATM